MTGPDPGIPLCCGTCAYLRLILPMKVLVCMKYDKDWAHEFGYPHRSQRSPHDWCVLYDVNPNARKESAA